MHVDVTGKKTNPADEVIARLIDYGPLSLMLVILAAFVVIVPYPPLVRWGFAVVVGLFLLSYQYLVSTDLRPTLPSDGVSARWFLTGAVTGVVGFYAPLSILASFGVSPSSQFGLVTWVPLQVGTGLMVYMSAQGLRQRHSLMVSLIGILMTSLLVACLHLALLRRLGVPF